MEKLVILCFPMSEMGHTNATIGIATALANKGHRIIFATERSWQGKFLKHGFEEELYDERDTSHDSAGKQWSVLFSDVADMMKKSPAEKLEIMAPLYQKMIENANYFNDRLEQIINRVKPDVIIEDHGVITPTLLMSKAPVVKLVSAAPLTLLHDDQLPPMGQGLPLNDASGWESGRKVVVKMFNTLVKLQNDFLKSKNPNLPDVGKRGFIKASNLTIYMYPKMLVEDYLMRLKADESLCRIDHCLRKTEGTFEIPDKLKVLPGKLIYLSMGSWGSSIVEMMNRLITILSESKNKFIVAKGHNHEKIELSDNMWGEEFVPQLDVLPLVDLVITHGGNNSFVETLYFGKPMIVLPLVGDQHDNGQRATELKIGRMFNPFTVKDREFIDAIELLLSDFNAKKTLQKISKQMQESDAMAKAIDRIEYIAKHPKSPNYY